MKVKKKIDLDIEIDCYDIDGKEYARFLANRDNVVQSDFFNEFFKELISCCGSKHGAIYQAISISNFNDQQLINEKYLEILEMMAKPVDKK